MEIPAYLLCLLGVLGGADIAIFHSVAHGIRSHPDSTMELATHSMRGPIYAALFLLLPNFALLGTFAWILPALFLLDVAVSVWDFWLEQESRRFLGGLPAGEYVLHMLMAMVFGSMVATSLPVIVHSTHEPTKLAYAPANVPVMLRLIMLTMGLLVLASGLEDARAALQSRTRPRRNGAAPNIRDEKGSASHEPILCRGQMAEKPTASHSPQADLARWMGAVLVAAGAYNLLWGGWVLLFPAAVFHWAGTAPSNYPQIWQCVGMIVGVYGLGYLIAARNPARHWAIVAVGLLGKVLGPLGMLWSIWQAQLSPNFIWICVTNDLIWWGPFALVLRHALKHHRGFAANPSLPQLI
jgi:hypothetical protein